MSNQDQYIPACHTVGSITVQTEEVNCEERSDEIYLNSDIGQLEQVPEGENQPEDRKLTYYPMQENNARILLKRIQNILHLYSGKSLSDFDDFMFQIYTAKYNMLQQQTVKRLMDETAQCFQAKYYAIGQRDKLKEKAERRVHKYNLSSAEIERNTTLLEEAENNPNTLYLIVADEAHWGVGKGDDINDAPEKCPQVKSKSYAHNKLINCWDCKMYPNVIVLQVTATGFNLKTTGSRLQHGQRYIKHASRQDDNTPGSGETSQNGMDRKYELVQMFSRTDKYYKDMKGKVIKAENVEEEGRLHVVRWSEGHQNIYRRGMTLRLRFLTKLKDRPMWLRTISNCIDKVIPITATYEEIDAMELNITGDNMRKVHIKTRDDRDNSYQLVAYRAKNMSRSFELGFVNGTDSFMRNKFYNQNDVCDSFEVVNECGEDVLLLRVSRANKITALVSNSYLKFDQKNKTVILGRGPSDNGLAHLGLAAHDLEYSFLVDYCQSEEGVGQQYLSLNFFYNTMRNQEPNEQLIRGDPNYFNMMLQVVKEQTCVMKSKDGEQDAQVKNPMKQKQKESKITAGEKNKLMNDYMSADYAFNIILHSAMQQCSLSAETFIFLLENPIVSLQDNKFYSKLQEFKEELKTTGDKLPSISCANFENYVKYIQSSCNELIEDIIDTFKKMSRVKKNDENQNKIWIDGVFNSIFTCLILMEPQELQTKFKLLHAPLKERPTLMEKFKLHYEEYKGQFKDITEKELKKSETFKIVRNVCSHSKFAVIRVHLQKHGHTFYTTIVKARKVASKEFFSFEIIRDFNEFMVGDIKYDSKQDAAQPKYRIHKRLQPNECQFVQGVTMKECPCNVYKPDEPSLVCMNCGHKHKEIKAYSDMNGLPCMLVLVNKGRLGDTFPDNFCGLDLRQWFHYEDIVRSKGTQTIYLSRLMQEFGRLCRYSYKPGQNPPPGKEVCYADLPYVLIGQHLLDCLVNSLDKFPVFHGYFAENMLLDEKIDQIESRKDHLKRAADQELHKMDNDGNVDTGEKQLSAASNNFDSGNTVKYWNRLLLEAEPQCGKTGVYLKLISLLTNAICQSTESFAYTSDNEIDESCSEEEAEDSSSDEEEEDEVKNISTYAPGAMPNFPVKERSRLSDISGPHNPAYLWHYPYWENINKLHYRGQLAGGKYERTHGSAKNHHIKAGNRNADKKDRKVTKRCIIDQDISKDTYKAFGYSHNCDMCSSDMLSSSYITLTVDLGGAEVKIQLPYQKKYIPIFKKYLHPDECKKSIPQGDPQSLSFTQLHDYDDQQQEKDDPRILNTWIFTPSYRRAGEASVNYYHTMVSGGEKCYYTQFLVVRQEEFKKYIEYWGRTHAIIALPDNIPGISEDVNSGGIGYARLVIQRLAQQWNLDQIFMIDDNFVSIHEIVTKEINGREYLMKEAKKQVTRSVPLFKALKHMERMFCYPDRSYESVKKAMDYGDFKFKPHPDALYNSSSRYALF